MHLEACHAKLRDQLAPEQVLPDRLEPVRPVFAIESGFPAVPWPFIAGAAHYGSALASVKIYPQSDRACSRHEYASDRAALAARKEQNDRNSKLCLRLRCTG